MPRTLRLLGTYNGTVARLSSRQIRLVQRPATRFPRRFASSNAESRTCGSVLKHALVGAAGGGAAVILGAYAYYHFSGLKRIVSATQSLSRNVKDAKDRFIEASPSPKMLKNLFRSKITETHESGGGNYSDRKSLEDAFLELKETATEDGEDGENLTKERHGGILRRLKEKAGKAKMAEGIKEDVSK